MSKNYEKPLAKVLAMGGEDIIQTSGGGLTDGGEDGTVGEGGTVGGDDIILGLGKAPIGFKTPGKFI